MSITKASNGARRQEKSQEWRKVVQGYEYTAKDFKLEDVLIAVK